jgi:hypothetical protein
MSLAPLSSLKGGALSTLATRGFVRFGPPGSAIDHKSLTFDQSNSSLEIESQLWAAVRGPSS